VYRGEDRRGVLAAQKTSPGAPFVVAGVALIVLALLVFVGWPQAPVGADAGSAMLVAQLEAGTLALALLLAALCFVYWRLVGDAGVLWLGTAVAAYSLVALLLSALDVSSVTTIPGLPWLQPAARIVVVGVVITALLTPEVDARLRPRRTMAVACSAIIVVALLLDMAPAVAGRIVTPLDPITLGEGDRTFGAALFTAFWSGLAICAFRLGLRRRRHILAWAGLLFFGLAMSQLAWLLVAAGSGVGWATSPHALRVSALSCAVIGATLELVRAYVQQGGKLLESVAAEQTATARMEAELATQAERAHEASNALAAIEGATRTLQSYQDRLDPAARADLAAAVSEEVHRLQSLLSAETLSSTPGRFRPTEALAAVVTTARFQGAMVRVDVPDHLVAVGQPADTIQVLHNLLQNARRYAGGEIVITATLERGQIVIRVADDGPGIPEEERELIFERGRRGSTAGTRTGSGLGLYISSRLMREQDGSLEVTDSPTGGACFVLRLPGFSELAARDVATDEVEDGLDEAGELVTTEPTVLLFARYRQRRAGRVEHQDGVGEDLALEPMTDHR
jgi:signal transduction histidine kinase